MSVYAVQGRLMGQFSQIPDVSWAFSHLLPYQAWGQWVVSSCKFRIAPTAPTCWHKFRAKSWAKRCRRRSWPICWKPDQCASVAGRHRPCEGQDTGRSAHRHLRDATGEPRSLRERLQPLWAFLSCHGAGRCTVSYASRGYWSAPGAQCSGGDDSVEHSDPDQARLWPGSGDALQQLSIG